jgi:hypothetical protein
MTEREFTLTEVRQRAEAMGYWLLVDYRQLGGGIHPYVLHEIGTDSDPDFVSHSSVTLGQVWDMLDRIQRRRELEGRHSAAEATRDA